MERIGSMANNNTELALERLLKSDTATGLVKSPARSLSLPDLEDMALLMGQVKVNYGTQTLPAGWAEGTRSHWTVIAERYGMDVLREAVTRHMDESDFLPKRSEINRHVDAILERREATRQEAMGRTHLDELASWKKKWERDRAEDAAALLLNV